MSIPKISMIAAVILAVTGTLLLVISSATNSVIQGRFETYYYESDGEADSNSLSEETALRFALRALQEAGYDVSAWNPMPDERAAPGDSYALRNPERPQEARIGFVREPPGGSLYVRVSRDERVIHCEVFRPK